MESPEKDFGSAQAKQEGKYIIATHHSASLFLWYFLQNT